MGAGVGEGFEEGGEEGNAELAGFVSDGGGGGGGWNVVFIIYYLFFKAFACGDFGTFSVVVGYFVADTMIVCINHRRG